MYRRTEITHLLSEFKNTFAIDVNPISNNVLFSADEKVIVMTKDSFLSYQSKDKEQPHLNSVNLEDNESVLSLKYSLDGNSFLVNTFGCKLSEYLSNDFSVKHVYDQGKFTGAYSTYIFDHENKSLLKTIDNRGKYIYSIALLDDNTCFTGSSSGSVSIININEGKIVKKIEEHCLPVRSITLNRTNNHLFSASDDLHINQIDIVTNKVIIPLVGHKDKINKLLYNETKGLLFSASSDGNIKIWDPKAKFKLIESLNPNDKNSLNIYDIGINKEGNFITYTSDDGIGAFVS